PCSSSRCCHPRPLSSFPTRRSSDLSAVFSFCRDPRGRGRPWRPENLHSGRHRRWSQRVLFRGRDCLSLPVSSRRRQEERTTQMRSEEHTSELQSRGHLVCRLLLEKK